MQRRQITLTRTKNNKTRTLYVSDALAEILREAMARSPEDSPYVFTQEKGKNRGKPYSLAGITLAFRRAVAATGIENLRLHDIRHDAATKMRRNGVGLDVIKEVLGHSNIAVSNRYAHVETSLIRAALDGVPAPIARPLPDEAERHSATVNNGVEKAEALY
jgi:integrase